MQILVPHFSCIEARALRVELSNLCFYKPSSWFWGTPSVRALWRSPQVSPCLYSCSSLHRLSVLPPDQFSQTLNLMSNLSPLLLSLSLFLLFSLLPSNLQWHWCFIPHQIKFKLLRWQTKPFTIWPHSTFPKSLLPTPPCVLCAQAMRNLVLLREKAMLFEESVLCSSCFLCSEWPPSPCLLGRHLLILLDVPRHHPLSEAPCGPTSSSPFLPLYLQIEMNL